MTTQLVLPPIHGTTHCAPSCITDGIDNPWQVVMQFVETELRRSQVYHQFIATLQTSVGDLAEEAIAQLDTVLTKAVDTVLTKVAQLTLEQCQTLAQSCHWHDEPAGADDNERYHQLELELESKQDVVDNLVQPSLSGVQSNLTDMLAACTTKQPRSTAMLETNSRSVPLYHNEQAAITNAIQPSTLPANMALADGLTARATKRPQPPSTLTANAEDNDIAAILRRIGQEVKHHRLAQTMSLEKLHYLTVVPIYHLRALESGQVEQLPELVYVRGFIRRIGHALMVDSDRWLTQLASAESSMITRPSWQPLSQALGSIQISSVYLYMGYAALMAGAIGSLVAAQPSVEQLPEELLPEHPHSSNDQMQPVSALLFNAYLSVAVPEALGVADFRRDF